MEGNDADQPEGWPWSHSVVAEVVREVNLGRQALRDGVPVRIATGDNFWMVVNGCFPDSQFGELCLLNAIEVHALIVTPLRPDLPVWLQQYKWKAKDTSSYRAALKRNAAVVKATFFCGDRMCRKGYV